MAEKYPGVLYSAGYDVQTDRIEIRVANAVAIELGPKEWFFGDEEVRDLLTAKLHNVVRANLPQ